jgi:hypothetical protein
MKNTLSGPAGYTALICSPGSTPTEIEGFFIAASPGSEGRTVAKGIFVLFPGSIDISDLPAAKNGGASFGNGCAKWF